MAKEHYLIIYRLAGGEDLLGVLAGTKSFTPDIKGIYEREISRLGSQNEEILFAGQLNERDYMYAISALEGIQFHPFDEVSQQARELADKLKQGGTQ